MINSILRSAVNASASDLHIHAGVAPYFRINTVIHRSPFPPVSAPNALGIAKGMLDERRWADFEQKRDADFSYEIPGLSRFRVNIHYQRGAVALSIRVIPSRIRKLAELSIPEVVNRLTSLPRGLILVTGATGSGKSATLAAMIEEINHRDRAHIVTLEDPIEYLFTGAESAIEQREVGSDVPDYPSGLRHVLRQDPDVILLGQMRDMETTTAALTAAESGHLVLSSLHTLSAAQTIERIIHIYPPDQQPQIRSMLAGTLQAVISQTLLPRADEPGMVPAIEIMLCNPAIKTCILENRLFEIATVIETNRAAGMQSLDGSIQQLCRTRYITRHDALAHATQPERLERALVA